MILALATVGVGAGIGFAMIVNAFRSSICDRPLRLKSTALRCRTCGIDWPADPAHYGRCPACLTPTAAIAGATAQPLEAGEARSIRLHHEFERFYDARE